MSEQPHPQRTLGPKWRRPSIALAAAATAALAAVSVGRAANVGFFSAPADAGASPSPSAAAASASASAAPSTVTVSDANGNHRNLVLVSNHHDTSFRARGSIDLNVVKQSSAAPLNEAEAFSQCNDCQTLAVAMQINLIAGSATSIQPGNFAVAANYQCQSCTTVALAFQYNLTVADPDVVPPRVKELVHDMDAALRQLQQGHETVDAAVSDVEQVIGQYKDLVQDLQQLKKESTAQTDAGATPVPEDSPTPSVAASESPSVTASPSGADTTSASLEPTASP